MGCFERGTWLVCFVEVAVAVVGNIGHQVGLWPGALWRKEELCNPVLVEMMLAIAKSTRCERSQLN